MVNKKQFKERINKQFTYCKIQYYFGIVFFYLQTSFKIVATFIASV